MRVGVDQPGTCQGGTRFQRQRRTIQNSLGEGDLTLTPGWRPKGMGSDQN